MLKLYKYLYYRLYAWNLRTWGESDMPQFNAMLGVSFMMGLNFSVVLGIFDIMGFKTLAGDNPKMGLVLMVTLIVVNYFWLVSRGRYLQIAKEYKAEPKKKRTKNAILLWIYVILSWVIVISEFVVAHKLHGPY